MKSSIAEISFISIISVFIFSQCRESIGETPGSQFDSTKYVFGGFGTQQKWGEHLVRIAGCHDCHTPKMMTDHGPDFDFSLALSGHPAHLPAPDVNRSEMESKGLGVTGDLTAWVGPWGVSYAANLTSDSTGTGNWKEEQFIYALREGKYKGLPGTRDLLPPMPWPMYKNMTDGELKAIFAYLKSTKPIKNVVPPPQPPLTASN